MKCIINPDPLVMKLLKPAGPDSQRLHQSQFSVPLSVNGSRLLYHTLTKECLLLSEDEYKSLNSFDSAPDPADPLISYLTTHSFLTSSENECRTYCSVISLLRTVAGKKKIRTYTILPTTFCNARCFYCYELDYHFTSMDEETENRMIQFIMDTHTPEGIKLRWFGGEPLLGLHTIRKVSDRLEKEGIPFKAEMISNGSLFTNTLVKEAAERWHLKKVQITLDGNEEEYNRRKNYKNKDFNPFRTVIKNIHALQEEGIKVSLRLNTDFSNFQNLLELKDFLADEFSEKKGITVYCHPLFSELNSEKCAGIWEKCAELETEFHNAGFTGNSMSRNGRLRSYYCIACDPSAVTFDPSGDIFGCEHCHPESRLGSLASKEIKQRPKTVKEENIQQKCRMCPYLPICTEFSECPDTVYSCTEVRRIRLQRSLSRLLKQQDQ